jgi:outer membrane protein assembly factor BamB
VYFGTCTNGLFRAVDRLTGRLSWATHVGLESDPNFFHGDPLITEDAVIIGADNGPPPASAVAGIYAFDRSTGKQLWFYPAGRGVAGRISGSGRFAYAATLDGMVVALDIHSGLVQWSFPVKLFGWGGPTLAGNRVFVGSGRRDGLLSALNAETGHVDWQRSLGAGITTAVAVESDNLYMGTSDGTMHRLDARDGTELGSLQIDATLKLRGLPVVAHGSVFVLLADGAENLRGLVAVDSQLARLRWRDEAVTRWHTTRIFVRGETLVLGTPSGEVVSYCAATGAIAGSHMLEGMIRSIAEAGDILYVGTTEGTLYALNSVSDKCPAH